MPETDREMSRRAEVMWHGACVLLNGALTIGLIHSRRRLGEAEAELERLRGAGSAPAPGAAKPPAATGDQADENESAELDAGTADLATEWEQAVPPMDS